MANRGYLETSMGGLARRAPLVGCSIYGDFCVKIADSRK